MEVMTQATHMKNRILDHSAKVYCLYLTSCHMCCGVFKVGFIHLKWIQIEKALSFGLLSSF